MLHDLAAHHEREKTRCSQCLRLGGDHAYFCTSQPAEVQRDKCMKIIEEMLRQDRAWIETTRQNHLADRAQWKQYMKMCRDYGILSAKYAKLKLRLHLMKRFMADRGYAHLVVEE